MKFPYASGDYNRYAPTAARPAREGAASRPAVRAVDVHAHIFVPESEALVTPRLDPADYAMTRFTADLSARINDDQGADRHAQMTDPEVRCAELDALGIDFQLVTVAPFQCYYSLDAGLAAEANALTNAEIARFVAARPERFAGLGVVTLQDPDRAVAELDAIMATPGMKGVIVRTNVMGEELAEPRFEPFFVRAEALGAVVMLHPSGFTHGERLRRHYLTNTIGNPLETTIALAHLILGGTLERLPDLKLLALHGGGFIASYFGRFDHAWGARDDATGNLPHPPSHYLRKVWIDTLVHGQDQLAALLAAFGPERLVMGTDYPFDMAEYDPIGHIAGLDGIDEATFSALAGGNAARLLGL